MRRKLPSDHAEVVAFREAVIDRAKGRCQAGSRIADVDFDAGRRCTGWATEAHHIEPRGMGGGGNNDPSNGLAACHACHVWLESYRDKAVKLGLLKKHGRPSKIFRDEPRD